MRTGTNIGMSREATVVGYNSKTGIVEIAIDEGNLYGSSARYKAPLPAIWAGPEGQFMGGDPVIGATVLVKQGQGGQWYIENYIKSNNSFTSYSSSDTTKMSALKAGSGRALIQVKNDNLLFLDPNIGTHIGNHSNFLHINPNLNIISHNFKEKLSFTESGRNLDQVVKRDLVENSSRNILGSTLDSQVYDQSLSRIGMDPSASISFETKGNLVRNPALVEKRSLTYEFANSFNFTTDLDEATRYTDPTNKAKKLLVSKRQMRSDTLSLSLEHPNHLIETIQGTVVDSVGNILDLNRNPLPIGKNTLSLRKNSDKSNAFTKIREAHRKSIAYHLEINTRKSLVSEGAQIGPDPSSKEDYGRSRSKFFIDIDKEGQFKINVPASSETGNIPLLTRYENYSNLLSKEEDAVNPNAFVRNEEKKDIFLENHAPNASISLTAENLEEYAPALDRFTNEPIKLGTAYHDITKVLSEFQESAGFRQVGLNLVDFNETHPLNKTDVPYSKIVSNEIIVSGPNANAGGRSGTITMDGMLSLNIGANTIDRQSLWLDTAGGAIACLGRDKQGISLGASLDGDLVIQVGGAGLGNSQDSRFATLNDAYRNGKVDIRVLNNGQHHILRIDETGIHVISAGRMTFSSQQGMHFRSNSNMTFEAETIVMYGETSKRPVNRFPLTSI